MISGAYVINMDEYYYLSITAMRSDARYKL